VKAHRLPVARLDAAARAGRLPRKLGLPTRHETQGATFHMKDQRSTYKILAVVFGVAGIAWIIGGFTSVTHFILYPFIGVVNLGIAYLCKQMSK
jgi:hypothetical protein